MEKKAYQISMERTFSILDTVDIKSLMNPGHDIEIYQLMDKLEDMLHTVQTS